MQLCNVLIYDWTLVKIGYSNMSSAMVTFNKDQDEILVECVAKHPPIYNSQNMDCEDLNIRDAIWKDIRWATLGEERNFKISSTTDC